MNSIETHYQRAARARHAPAARAKKVFFALIAERLGQCPVGAADPKRFAGIERQRLSSVQALLNAKTGLQLRLSTLKTWLRQWARAAALTTTH
ncbi:hypothetical protein [Inhella sp.]|uniref:hypothetical protein n=1 Tax=Inhella sp. TaxID=1921806 RepID=UPI0035B2BB93